MNSKRPRRSKLRLMLRSLRRTIRVHAKTTVVTCTILTGLVFTGITLSVVEQHRASVEVRRLFALFDGYGEHLLSLERFHRMSTRLIVATGNEKWIAEQESMTVKLNTILDGLKLNVPDLETRPAWQEFEKVRRESFSTEDKITQLVRQGNLEQAGSLLFDDKYRKVRFRYQNAVERLIADIQERLVSKHSFVIDSKNHFILLSAIVVSCICFVWGFVLHCFATIRRDQTVVGEDLDAARALLARAGAVKAKFLSHLSHQVRTPLNGILGNANLLAEEPLSLEQMDCLENLKSCAHDLLNFIKDSGDYSRIEAGDLEIEAKAFDIYEALGLLLKLHKHRAKRLGYDIQLRFDKSIPRTVIGDKRRFQQVVANLLEKVILASDESGSIFIRVEPLDEGNRVLKLRFVIANSEGAGATEQDKNAHAISPVVTAFDSFEDESIVLSVTAGLISLMGGNLSLEESSTSQNIFDFTLSFKQVTAGEHVESSAENSNELPSRLSILLVEDDRVNRHLACRWLEQEGHKVTIAKNGVEAVKIGAQENFDIILMDIHMPKMNGLDAATAIRAMETLSYTPIVALTAQIFNQDSDDGLPINIDALVKKPISKDELLSTMYALTANS